MLAFANTVDSLRIKFMTSSIKSYTARLNEQTDLIF